MEKLNEFIEKVKAEEIEKVLNPVEGELADDELDKGGIAIWQKKMLQNFMRH